MSNRYPTEVLIFFIFSKERLRNYKKNTKKSSKKDAKVAFTVSRAVHATGHVHWPNKFKTAWETKLQICWRFGEVQTSFYHSMDKWKNSSPIFRRCYPLFLITKKILCLHPRFHLFFDVLLHPPNLDLVKSRVAHITSLAVIMFPLNPSTVWTITDKSYCMPPLVVINTISCPTADGRPILAPPKGHQPPSAIPHPPLPQSYSRCQ